MHSSQFGITFTDSRGPMNSDGPIHCIRSLNRMVRYSVMPLPVPGPKSCHSYEKHILYVIVQKTGISEACKAMFLNGIIVYTNQKTVYFAVYSSFPQLRIQILWQITFLSTMEHASIFFEPRRWWEVVDLNNFACLVPLHVPTIYSMMNKKILHCQSLILLSHSRVSEPLSSTN